MVSNEPARGGDEPIIGIDLGTTHSLVAFCDERGPRVLGPSDDEVMPSVVRYEAWAGSPSGRRAVVGRDAREAALDHPSATISSVKRLMGRSRLEVADDLAYLSYVVEDGSGGVCRIRLPEEGGGGLITPQEVSADILAVLRDRATSALGVTPRRAVVTVPAYFDDAQRQATRDAGRLAGLEVVRILNEPTAAALAYGLGLDRSAARNLAPRDVAVYDLGGGTFDVTVLRITPGAGEGEGDVFRVLATAGDTRLGGDDIDRAIVRLLIAEIPGLGAGVEVSSVDPAVRRALVGFARDVKHRLSEDEAAPIRLELGGGRVYERTLTRAELATLAAPFVERSVAACHRALRDAGLEARELDAVILVGGSTRMPAVRDAVREAFGCEPYVALDPDRVVALGAAVQADVIRRARAGGGAGGRLLLDVIPLSLGLETAGGAVAKIIARNTTVPTRATEMFSTQADGQTSVKLHVLQGERERVEDCRSLAEFHLRGLPPMPAGVPQLEVEFLVDANGVLSVSATERRSGRRAAVQVVPNHGLTGEEVDRIERDSYAHAREDMDWHRVNDLVVNAKLDLKWIGERLDAHAAALGEEEAGRLRALASELRTLVERAEADWRSVEPAALHDAKQRLDEASIRLQEVAITASLRERG